MNRIERLVGRAGRPSTGASHDRSAQLADVLDDHVVFEVESIDRMYLSTCGSPGSAAAGQGFFVTTAATTAPPR
jgi:hypothetical protein